MKLFLYVVFLLGTLSAADCAWAGEVQTCDYQAPETEFQWVTTKRNITQFNTGLRHTHKDWYSEFCAGGISAFDNRENAFMLSLNLGRRFFILPRLFVGVDLGYMHVIPDGSDNIAIDTGKYFALEGRIKLEVVLGKHMSAFGGFGTASIYNNYSLGSDKTNKGILFIGVGLL